MDRSYSVCALNSPGPATARPLESFDAYRIRPRANAGTAARKSSATTGSGSNDVRVGTGATAASARDGVRAPDLDLARGPRADRGRGGDRPPRRRGQASRPRYAARPLRPHPGRGGGGVGGAPPRTL